MKGGPADRGAKKRGQDRFYGRFQKRRRRERVEIRRGGQKCSIRRGVTVANVNSKKL